MSDLVGEWADTYREHRKCYGCWLIDRLHRVEAERDAWRKQALEEDARANKDEEVR